MLVWWCKKWLLRSEQKKLLEFYFSKILYIFRFQWCWNRGDDLQVKWNCRTLNIGRKTEYHSFRSHCMKNACALCGWYVITVGTRTFGRDFVHRSSLFRARDKIQLLRAALYTPTRAIFIWNLRIYRDHHKRIFFFFSFEKFYQSV